MEYKEYLIKGDFVLTVPYTKGGSIFGLVYRIMKLNKSRGTKQSEYVDF